MNLLTARRCAITSMGSRFLWKSSLIWDLRSRKPWKRHTPKESFNAHQTREHFRDEARTRESAGFGLAKLVPKAIASGDGDSSDASASANSIVGIISGTPSYMSPEQVRGDDLDPRTDIFSLGLVFYEMATGRQAFGGGTGGAIIEAVLTRPPMAVRTSIRMFRRCWKRSSIRRSQNREQRYEQTAEMVAELQRVKRISTPVREIVWGTRNPSPQSV